MNHGTRDPLGVGHRLVGCDVASKVLFVYPPERSQERAQPRAGSFAAIAMHFADAVSIIVARPLAVAVHRTSVMHSRVPGLEFVGDRQIAAPLVRVEDRRAFGHAALDHRQTRLGIRMMAHEEPDRVALTPDEREDRWPVGFISAVPSSFVGAASGRVLRVGVRRAFFPPRSGTTHQPQRLAHQADLLAARGADSTAPLCAWHAGGHAQYQVHVRAVRWTRLWRSRAKSTPVWRVAGGSSQRLCPSGLSGSGRTPCSDTRSAHRSVWRRAARPSRSADTAIHQDADVFRATQDLRARQAVRQWKSQSYMEFSLHPHLGDT